jgi:hypothetical protein
MRTLLLLPLLYLVACQQPTLNKPGKPVIPVAPVDTVPDHPNAFNWDWERPKEKIILPTELTRYITKGQEPIDSFIGDINADNLLDLIIVSGLVNEDSLRFAGVDMPRELLLFIGLPNDRYQLACKNKKAIPCGGCCGMSDPYAGMSVKKGGFTINEYCASNWKSIAEYRFHYRPLLKDWLLDTVIRESYAFYYEYYEVDTTTQKDFGKKSIRKFVMYEDTD